MSYPTASCWFWKETAVFLRCAKIDNTIMKMQGESMEQERSSYDIEFTDVALKNLRKYPRNDQSRILTQIENLAKDPHTMPNVKRLVSFDISYRLRVGNYRILFDRDDIIRVIDVIDILPRGQAYRR